MKFAAGWVLILTATALFWVFVVAVILHIIDTY